MLKKNTLQQITGKIEQLQSALFFPATPNRSIPTCIVYEVKADEDGNIWFTVPATAYKPDQAVQHFACNMDFFRKGEAFHVKIKGLATIVPHGTATNFSKENPQQHIIKVAIEEAECFAIPPIASEKKNSLGSIAVLALNKLSNQIFGKSLSPAI